MPEPLQPVPRRQIIRNVTWLVAWDEAAQSHVYRRDVDLTVEGDTVTAIGPGQYASPAQRAFQQPDGRPPIPAPLRQQSEPRRPFKEPFKSRIRQCRIRNSAL